MTHPALYRNTLCETICTKCGDSTKTLVDDEIIAATKGHNREIKMLCGCAICQHTQFLLVPPRKQKSIIDEMFEGAEL
jgi:uncharacterized protein YuzB (UPF0349 family)